MYIKKTECMYRGGARRDLTSSKVYKALPLRCICCCKSQYMYEYIIETEASLSELKTLFNCKET